MPGRRCASMLLPAPGDRSSSRLCSPAAAISSARRAPAWPRTSREVGSGTSRRGRRPAGSRASTVRCPARGDRLPAGALAPKTRPSWTRPASDEIARPEGPARGRTGCPAAPSAVRREWHAGLRRAKARRTARSRRTAPAGSCVDATSIPTAIGRSNLPPSLGRSAGARLTVMWPAGSSKPQFASAARTRSLLSFTAVSGRPTIEKAGRPAPTYTSTRTSGASRPCWVRLRMVAKVTASIRWARVVSMQAARAVASTRESGRNRRNRFR